MSTEAVPWSANARAQHVQEGRQSSGRTGHRPAHGYRSAPGGPVLRHSLKDCAGGRGRTGVGLVNPRDFYVDTDIETIERELYASEEYQELWGSEE